MCTCNRILGIICPSHCKGDGCRDGHHVDLCVGPGRIPLLESYARAGIEVTSEMIRLYREVMATAMSAVS